MDFIEGVFETIEELSGGITNIADSGLNQLFYPGISPADEVGITHLPDGTEIVTEIFKNDR